MAVIDKFDLAGRCAFITGASSGIGRRFAEVLAEQGAHCVIAARRTDRLADLKREIETAGGKAHAVALDVTDGASIEAALAEAKDAFGPVRILINNAGIAGRDLALDVSEEDWRAILDTNLDGVWKTARAAANQMIEAGTPASIVNVASILGLGVSKGTAPYAIAKAAVVQLTRALALEWARHDIRVNAIAPGYVETDINRDFLKSDAGKAMIKRIPQRRVGAVEDLDGVLMLLASDASAFMTGATIVVDGGQTLDIS